MSKMQNIEKKEITKNICKTKNTFFTALVVRHSVTSIDKSIEKEFWRKN